MSTSLFVCVAHSHGTFVNVTVKETLDTHSGGLSSPKTTFLAFRLASIDCVIGSVRGYDTYLERPQYCLTAMTVVHLE